jgi:hypothetical protein
MVSYFYCGRVLLLKLVITLTSVQGMVEIKLTTFNNHEDNSLTPHQIISPLSLLSLWCVSVPPLCSLCCSFLC